MKKVLIGIVLLAVVGGGTLYFIGYFDKAEATADDINKGEEVIKDLEDVYDNVEMTTEPVEKDSSLLEAEKLIEEETEEFDPEAML